MITREMILSKYPFLDLVWEIECGDGWLELIDNLLSQIYSWYLENHPYLLEEFKVMQIKEKYGELRVYVLSSFDEIFDMIDDATEKSSTICESCGNPGKQRDGIWIWTLCDNCYENKNRKTDGWEELNGKQEHRIQNIN